jgi:mRNA-degrading endonuclease RelE of RelBE toxin-antitoxin system
LKKIQKQSHESLFENIKNELRGLENKAGEDQERKIVQSVENCWRIKVKDWRILYKVDEALKII